MNSPKSNVDMLVEKADLWDFVDLLEDIAYLFEDTADLWDG